MTAFHDAFVEVVEPPELGEDEMEESLTVDHGGIDLRFFARQEDMKRVIYKHLPDMETIHDQYTDDGNEYNDNYYAFDDDEKRSPYAGDEKIDVETHECHRTSWHRQLPINCNVMHEFDFLRYVFSADDDPRD